MNLKNMTDLELHNSLKNKASAERAILVDVVSHIHEADRRRLYIKYNHPSLFDYLVKEMNNHGGSAQRRIDAARLLGDVPEIRGDIASGALNLMQLSAVSQGLKQKIREGGLKATDLSEQKRELISKVKGKSLAEAQMAIAQTLDIKIKTLEKKVCQKDGSMRVELTLTVDQLEKLQKVKDLISHSHPGATISEILELGLNEIIKKKDPASKGARRKSISTTTVEVNAKTTNLRRAIAAHTKRVIFQRDLGCQWRESGKICGSTFQSQIDHVIPVRAGGGNDLENLQVLCSRHNKIKYEKEVGRI